MITNVTILGFCLATIPWDPKVHVKIQLTETHVLVKFCRYTVYAELYLRRSVLECKWWKNISNIWAKDLQSYRFCMVVWHWHAILNLVQVLFLQKYCQQNTNVCTPDSIDCFQEAMGRGLGEKGKKEIWDLRVKVMESSKARWYRNSKRGL